MSEILRLVGIVTLVSVIAAWSLAYTYTVTRPIIDRKRNEKTIQTIAAVLPRFDNRPEQESVKIPNEKGGAMEFYVARKNGQPAGVAFKSFAPGYGGMISLIIGVTPEGKVYDVKILSQNETPGLGNKIASEDFTRQFQGKGLADRWDVKKQGGEFDQITAATVSSRAVIRAIQEGLAIYQKNADKILQPGKGS